MSGANWNCKTDEEREALIRTTSALGWKSRPYFVSCTCAAGCDNCRPPPESSIAYLVWRDNPVAHYGARLASRAAPQPSEPTPWFYYPPLQ